MGSATVFVVISILVYIVQLLAVHIEQYDRINKLSYGGLAPFTNKQFILRLVPLYYVVSFILFLCIRVNLIWKVTFKGNK